MVCYYCDICKKTANNCRNYMLPKIGSQVCVKQFVDIFTEEKIRVNLPAFESKSMDICYPCAIKLANYIESISNGYEEE